MSVPHSTFGRFLIAGALNTIFGFLIYSAAIICGLLVWQALLTGMLAGVGINFCTIGGFVFRDLVVSRFWKFSAAYMLIYWINLGLVELISKWVDSAILTQAMVTVPMAVGSYFLMSRFVFRHIQNGIEQ